MSNSPEYDLEEITPKMGEFKLKATGDKIHKTRKMNLSDIIWAREKLGTNALEDLASGKDIKLSTLCKIMYRLMKDRSEFPARDDLDDDGEEMVKIPGWQVFAESIEMDEINDVLGAFFSTYGGSMPKPREGDIEIEQVPGEEKKSQIGAGVSTKLRKPIASSRKKS